MIRDILLSRLQDISINKLYFGTMIREYYHIIWQDIYHQMTIQFDDTRHSSTRLQDISTNKLYFGTMIQEYYHMTWQDIHHQMTIQYDDTRHSSTRWQDISTNNLYFGTMIWEHVFSHKGGTNCSTLHFTSINNTLSSEQTNRWR